MKRLIFIKKKKTFLYLCNINAELTTMSDNVTIKQFTREKDGTLVAPYTPEHAVYGKDNKRLDTKLSDYDTRLDRIEDILNPFTVDVKIDTSLFQKGTTGNASITITPKRGGNNTEVDSITINGNKYTENLTIPYIYSITVTANEKYDVKVEKGDKVATGSVSVRFVGLSYSGVVPADFVANDANVKALTSALVGSRSREITVSPAHQKICIAYPKEFKEAASIKDGNGFDYLDSYTRSEISIDNEEYYVYLLNDATSVINLKQTIA